MKPLEGVRILSLEVYGAGPYGTSLLAALGAEVIKVENAQTGGDISRSVGPYLLGDNDSEFFQSLNAAKKSVCVDLKSDGGKARFVKLLEDADALVNNLRGDQPAKLGLRYEDVKTANPKIVCAHLSAYGRDNERTTWPGYDYLMQAECGFLSLTGEPDGPPARFGLSMVDFHTGTMMALGLVSAVMNARQTGEGCDIDTALYDTALHQLSYPAAWYLNEGHVTTRLSRSSHPSVIPSQLFRAADGWVFVMCQTPKFWQLFCEAVGAAEWLEDTRFASPAARLEHREDLQALIDSRLGERNVAEWVAVLSGKVPVAPVYDIAEALDNPFAHQVGMISQVEHPEKPEGLRLLSCPIRVNGARPPIHRAPALGEHDEELRR
ncbi:MAG: CoA transferase [Gammaproteobacteria bacterium]|nr:CoA transferase [Gammaproteobacteria bacterium]MCY4324207.1 CoA transferase [Gammaproteobacteria bacterium]